MIGFGGHHLGLNVGIAGQRGTTPPTLTGAQPCVFSKEGRTLRVPAGENDKAFALLHALDPAQQGRAILPFHVADLVLGPDYAAGTIIPADTVLRSKVAEAERSLGQPERDAARTRPTLQPANQRCLGSQGAVKGHGSERPESFRLSRRGRNYVVTQY